MYFDQHKDGICNKDIHELADKNAIYLLACPPIGASK